MVWAMCYMLLYLICVAPGAAPGAHPTSVSDHIWRGEYTRALAATEIGKCSDRAVWYTLTGDLDSASRLLGDTEHSMRRGLISFKSGRFEDAIKLLEIPAHNAFLDSYRLLYRARSLMEIGRYADSMRDLEALLDTTCEQADIIRHPIMERAANCLIEASILSARTGGIWNNHVITRHALTDKSFFLLTRHAAENGSWDAARGYLLAGIAAVPDTGAAAPFTDAVRALEERFKSLDKSELVAIARYAIRIGALEAADIVIKQLTVLYSQTPESRYLKGMRLAAAGEPRRALERFSRIFRSKVAPVSLKKESLLQIAAMEYRLKRYRRAGESYSLFGRYYPDDPRSTMALDTAARIAIARRRWPQALSLWREIRQRNVWTARSNEAALSEAALHYKLGHRQHAYRILSFLAPRCDGTLRAAALYWLQLTCSDQQKRKIHRDELLRTCPHSFYAFLLEHGEGGLVLDTRQVETGKYTECLKRLEKMERHAFESITNDPATDDTLRNHPAHLAFDYFLRYGFLDEAAECATFLKILFKHDSGRMMALYRDTRSQGGVALGLTLLNSVPRETDGGVDTGTLRYPVAYSGIIGPCSEQRGLPPDLILAVIREESAFDSKALSRAGARGLMQLMPATGLWIGRKLGKAELSTDDLFSVAFNIEAGMWYLGHLLNRFDGSIVAALAAYNAGASRMSRWRKNFCPSEDPLVAIEMIGPQETRTYVRRVLDSYSAYRMMGRDRCE
ncbi:MAG: lytic transglycosylase domain-containing protein [bacterium]|nr:MAG: lytic transglycosylase domain-containing protein [bacterium]